VLMVIGVLAVGIVMVGSSRSEYMHVIPRLF
jgi:hypothetical protein